MLAAAAAELPLPQVPPVLPVQSRVHACCLASCLPLRRLCFVLTPPTPSRAAPFPPSRPPDPCPLQKVDHMVDYEHQLRQEVLLNIERLQVGGSVGGLGGQP